MRMRKKKHGAERILACAELLIEDPSVLKDDPAAPFSNKDKKLCLEIGCGKGNFAVGTAAKDTDCNIIAMERVRDVCCLALEKAMACKDTRPDNLRFIIGDADNLEEWFPEKCLDVLYLNFSDPWPKAGHAKRRLTHRNYLAKYKKLLNPGAYAIAPYNNTNYSFNIWGGRAEGNTIGLYNHPDGGHSMWMLENPKVPTPVITIDGDGYATISCSLAGVTFRYTINGDTPTVASAVYDENNKPKLNDGDRIRVLGTLQNYDDSDEASMVANVVAPVPTITIADDGTVSIASTLADAVIYYTVDGEAPTETSTVYHAPFKVGDKTLVRAIAVKSEYQSSPVASRYYSTSAAALQGNGTDRLY